MELWWIVFGLLAIAIVLWGNLLFLDDIEF